MQHQADLDRLTASLPPTPDTQNFEIEEAEPVGLPHSPSIGCRLEIVVPDK